MSSYDQMLAAIERYSAGGLSPWGQPNSPGSLPNPWKCNHCGNQLEIPYQAGNGKWFQRCENCGRTQRLAPYHPVVKQMQEPTRPRVPVQTAKCQLPPRS